MQDTEHSTTDPCAPYTRDARFDDPRLGLAWRDRFGLLLWRAAGTNPNN